MRTLNCSTRFLALVMSLVCLTACNESGTGPAVASAPVDGGSPALDPGGDPDPVLADPGDPVVEPTVIPLTIYTLSRTIAPSTSYPSLTFTALASCVEYDSRQYCWDDGLHQTTGGPITFNDNYFGLQAHATTGNPQTCKLSCNASYMSTIRDVTSYRNISMVVLGGTLGQEIDHILATGTATNTSCTLSGQTLTCGTLVISL